MAPDITTYRVSEIMSPSVISVSPNDTIQEALGLMTQYRVTVLPVTDSKNRCIGVLSTSDLIDPTQDAQGELNDVEWIRERSRPWLIKKLIQDQLGQRQVSELMTHTVVTIDRESSIIEATGEMLRHRIHHLPVVDNHHKVLGIVSTLDALSIFHRLHADEGIR